MRLHNLFVFVLQLLLMCGCAGRIAPGHTQTTLPGLTAAATQSQDPQAVTTQIIESETVTHQGAPASGSVTETHHKISTTIGAAQKNMAQEYGAKLASVRGFQWFGIALALFGVASLVYPPLKLIVGSVTTSAACVAAGAAIVFLPLVIIGHEVLIIVLATSGVGLWFLAHRHGSVSGQLATLKNNHTKTS